MCCAAGGRLRLRVKGCARYWWMAVFVGGMKVVFLYMWVDKCLAAPCGWNALAGDKPAPLAGGSGWLRFACCGWMVVVDGCARFFCHFWVAAALGGENAHCCHCLPQSDRSIGKTKCERVAACGV